MILGTETMFSYEAPQDLSVWQKELDRLFPPNRELSHLVIRWEPGQEWDPVERYVIYQVLPADRIPLLVLPWLEGPDPRDFTRFDRVKKEVVRKRGAPLVSRQQWLLYRETGGFGMPFWVVQGDKGGHKIKFNRTESMVARLKGHPTGTPPGIADLPYAPVDGRVIDKLVDLDMMRKFNLLIDFTMRNPAMLDRNEERGAEEAKERLWGWLEEQVGPWVEEIEFLHRRVS